MLPKDINSTRLEATNNSSSSSSVLPADKDKRGTFGEGLREDLDFVDGSGES